MHASHSPSRRGARRRRSPRRRIPTGTPSAAQPPMRSGGGAPRSSPAGGRALFPVSPSPRVPPWGDSASAARCTAAWGRGRVAPIIAACPSTGLHGAATSSPKERKHFAPRNGSGAATRTRRAAPVLPAFRTARASMRSASGRGAARRVPDRGAPASLAGGAGAAGPPPPPRGAGGVLTLWRRPSPRRSPQADAATRALRKRRQRTPAGLGGDNRRLGAGVGVPQP